MRIVHLEADYKPSPADVAEELDKLDSETQKRVTRVFKHIADLQRPEDYYLTYMEGRTAQQLNLQVAPVFSIGSARFIESIAPYYNGEPRPSRGLDNLWSMIAESFTWEKEDRFGPARTLMAHGRYLTDRFTDRESLLDPVRAVAFALVSDSKRFPSKSNPYTTLLELYNLDPALIALAEVDRKTPQGTETLEELHGHFLVNLQNQNDQKVALPDIAQTCLRAVGMLGLREPQIKAYFQGEDCNQRHILPILMLPKLPEARILKV